MLSAYWAALSLLNAELLFSNLLVREHLEPNAPRSVERHHLFPKAYLATKGVASFREVSAIANMAFVDWPENATIGAKSPREYWPTMTKPLDPDRLKRQCYWHALPVGWEQLDYPTFLERRRDLMAKVVRDGFNRLWGEGEPEPSSTLADLLSVGESQTVEFKSTARWNVRAGRHDKKMEHVITKTVCGFLNAEGGILLIGVDDEANVVGLADDLLTLGKKGNRDGYELFLRQHLDNTLSVPTAGIVSISFEQIGQVDVCVVSVAASGKPVFSRPNEKGHVPTEFWVRIGNATKQLYGDDMLDYRSMHWG